MDMFRDLIAQAKALNADNGNGDRRFEPVPPKLPAPVIEQGTSRRAAALLWGHGREHPGLTEAEAARCAAVRHRLHAEVTAQVAVPERWTFAKWLVSTGRLTEER